MEHASSIVYLDHADKRERGVASLHEGAHELLQTTGGVRVLRVSMANEDHLDDEQYVISSEAETCDGPEVCMDSSSARGRRLPPTSCPHRESRMADNNEISLARFLRLTDDEDKQLRSG